MTRNNVIDKTTKILKRTGFCSFDIDTETEELVEYNFNFDDNYDYTWNDTTFVKGDLKTDLKSRTTIMSEIFSGAEPTTQFPRLVDAIDLAFIVALDNFNHDFARQRLGVLKDAGDITQADYDFIDGILG